MALDIFSSFDDHNKVFLGWFYAVWFVMFISIVVISDYKVLLVNQLESYNLVVFNSAKKLYSQTKLSQIGGSASVVTVLMSMLVMMNLQGLLPYTFSLTSHLAVNLAFALPIWVAVVLLSASYDLSSFLAHLQPMGSPAALNPFLCVIELVSMLVRPLTLTVRITANLSTGHIMVGLLGASFSQSSVAVSAIILAVGSFYLLFEVAVCVVQSYIFTLLPTLYGDEHPSTEL